LLADGRIVAAVDEVYAGALGALPDINDNGRQEILLRNWFTGQGVTEDAFSIIELGTGEARNLGRFAGGVDACGTGRDDASAEAYRYWVRPGSEPVYFRQRLVKDDCDSDEWVADGEFVQVSPEIDPPSYPLLGS
jgi:hypothetical protein